MSLWKQLDTSHQFFRQLKQNESCFYAREYKADGSTYKGGDTNQLVFNFKKPPSRKSNTYEWQHRNFAVQKFATELKEVLPASSTVLAIPASKLPSDSEYDNRFEDMFTALAEVVTNLCVVNPIAIRATSTASHLGGTRSSAVIKSNYRWLPPVPQTERLFVVDDVIATGAHFRAAADFLRENGFQGAIVGLFWAISVWPSSVSGEESSDCTPGSRS